MFCVVVSERHQRLQPDSFKTTRKDSGALLLADVGGAETKRGRRKDYEGKVTED